MKNEKTNIKYVSIISNSDKIVDELESLIQNPTVIQNKPELEEQFLELKKNLENSSDTIKDYMPNKTGKYIIICRNEKHMQELISKSSELFESLNSNLQVLQISKRMKNNMKNSIIKEFNDCENQTDLKLLFVNGLCKADYQFSNIDATILTYATVDRGQEKINGILQSFCNNNSTIVQVFDNVTAISIFPILQKRIYENNSVDVEFVKTDSFSRIENLRNNIYSPKILDQFKLKIIREYKKETGEDVKANTVYKGYNLGSWMFNLREKDFQGKLEMDENIRKKFEDEGILGQRKRRKQTTDVDKYNLFVEYHKKNPDAKITQTTFDENGNPLGNYREWLQTKINQGTTELTDEQIETLKQIGCLNLSNEEKQKISKQYSIPKGAANSIIIKYKSIENFSKLYKQGKVDLKNINLNKRGIILSQKPLPINQKQKYLKLVEDIFGQEILNDISKFIVEEELLDCLDSLSNKEKYIISRRYMSDTNKKVIFNKLAKEMGISRARVEQLQARALKKIAKKIPVYSIKDLRKNENELLFKREFLEKMSHEKWTRTRLNVDIDNLNLSKSSTMRLRENGYNTIFDLVQISEKELSDIHTFGPKKVCNIIKKVNEAKATLLQHKKEDEIERVEKQLLPISSKISSYNNAYDYFMNHEDIFYTDGIIPPSIIINESGLKRKSDEKAKKQNTLNDLEEQINVQDKKTDKLVSIIGEELNTDKLDEHKYD